MLSWLFSNPLYYNYGYYGYSTPIMGYAAAPMRPPTKPDPYTEQRLHALEIACAGLWELLKQKNGLSDDELVAVIKDLDAKKHADPSLDKCPICGHPMLTHNHAHCLWCGADLKAQPFVPPASP
jgi:hypothetical protein